MEWLLDKPEWMRRPEVEARAKKEMAALLAGLDEMKKGVKRLFGGVGIPFLLACEVNDLDHEMTEGRRDTIIKRYRAAIRKKQTWRATGTETTRLKAYQRRNVKLAKDSAWIAVKRAAGWRVNRMAINLNKKNTVPIRTLNRWLAAPCNTEKRTKK